MKKFILGLLLGIFISTAPMALAADKIRIFIDGVELITDPAPVMYQDRVLLPTRAIAEALGVKIEWDQDAYAVKITTNKPIITDRFENIKITETPNSIIIEPKTKVTPNNPPVVERGNSVKNEQTGQVEIKPNPSGDVGYSGGKVEPGKTETGSIIVGN